MTSDDDVVPCKKRAVSLKVDDVEVDGGDEDDDKWIYAAPDAPAVGGSTGAASVGSLDDNDEV